MLKKYYKSYRILSLQNSAHTAVFQCYRKHKKTAIIFFYYDGCYVFNFIIFNYLIFKSENDFLLFYSLSPLYAFR